MDNLYEKLSKERKALQEAGEMAGWWSTGAWQLFKAKYLFEAKTPREQYRRIADTLAQYVEGNYPSWWVQEMGIGVTWADAFFNEMWQGNLSGSTPVISNVGTTRGFAVSCSGNVVGNSVYDIYESMQEVAVLTKNGFGTASYLGDIPPRGVVSVKGVKSGGVVEWIKGFVLTTATVSQGQNRRGAWAGYLPIDHGDFRELVAYLKDAPDGLNIGWNVSQDFISRLDAGDEDAIDRFQLALYTKQLTGKGYFSFMDKVNERRPEMYKKLGLLCVAMQLCVAPETLVLTDKGHLPIEALAGQLTTVWNGEEWSEVTVQKTSDCAELLRVTFSDNSVLECTRQHGFHVTRSPNNATQRVSAINLQVGDSVSRITNPDVDSQHLVFVTAVKITGRYDKTYCFTEPKRNMGVFNGILTANCNEIHLHSSEDLTYTCVLSSMNAATYDTWNKRSIFVAHVFLDCVNEDFVRKAKNVRGMEKAVKFAELGRPTGLGVCGFHTYLQKKRFPFDSIDAYAFNDELFTRLQDETLEASQWLASVFGESEWCKGFGVRNTHRTAVAPTKSSALLMAGVSEGINPDPAMTYTQLTSAGEVERVNQVLLELMKERGVYNKKTEQTIIDAQGSVQGVDWLTPEEKLVFRTAFEIDQFVILKLAAARQRRLCQGQSLNLFFSAEEDEEHIAAVHSEAFRNPLILGLYYCYSKSGVVASKNETCESCQ